MPAMVSHCVMELSTCLDRPDKQAKLALKLVLKLAIKLKEHKKVYTMYNVLISVAKKNSLFLCS